MKCKIHGYGKIKGRTICGYSIWDVKEISVLNHNITCKNCNKEMRQEGKNDINRL